MAHRPLPLHEISELSVKITPWHRSVGVSDGFMKLVIQTISNGRIYTQEVSFIDNDFESRFDLMMAAAGRHIKDMVKRNA